ncbi:uncharacterized protein MYCFIDRAFT_195165 [Pseudocercospora fijiensis CIRAD86]|uniref:Uncharacterized protein n=1 Tax=Pseudocercospora fijiensis (strain CIRAD86) TaxID=383855 RepID=M3AHC3_PSEFD|nr:uncharacterized protein MYCFIDRAFT_195165 [Pseudocercospora fijiensis CIRAD86]EME83981.1 hypothetical protein MYCFIDRAFT_195165 [Pseudocercospora fijiensis CIRAD86]
MASAEAAADSPTLGSESPDSMIRKTQQSRPKPAVTNFSRPRIFKDSSGKTYQEGDSNVKSVNAYYEQENDNTETETETETETATENGSVHQDRNIDEPMPSEPRFSLDDEEEDHPVPRGLRFSTSLPLPTEARFSVETFDLDPSDSNPKSSLTEGKTSLISRTEAFLKCKGSALLRTEDQRHPGGGILKANNNNNNTTQPNDSSESPRPQTSQTSSSCSTNHPRPLKSILKQTSIEITSELASSSFEAGEDTRSHHTISEDGEDGKEWHSSDFDASALGLSEKERKKLEKKGVNLSLYAEIKAARGSGKVVGALVGNG